jgi:hypothetical protein
VLTFRPTKKLAARVGLAVPPGDVPVETPHCDWCAHTFTAQRFRYIILTNTHSFFSVIMSSRGVTTEAAFIRSALGSIGRHLVESGRGSVFERVIAPQANEVQFASIPNRAVLGTITELVFLAQVDLVEGGLSATEVSSRLNEMPLSVLWKRGATIMPRETFDAMPASTGGRRNNG